MGEDGSWRMITLLLFVVFNKKNTKDNSLAEIYL